MGIRGLLGCCLYKRDECSEMVDLVAIAEKQDGIELLVDFYSFEHLISKNFLRSIQKFKKNPYIFMNGGEYSNLDRYVSKLVQDLKSLNISLVFYLDGTKGSSDEATRQKLDTWIERHEDELQKLQEVLNVCKGLTPVQNLLEESCKVRPVLLEIQFYNTLAALGCEIVQCPAGEADIVIAKALQERKKAYAIISNDSDFCVFKDCRFIPNELFDIYGDLQLGITELPEKPLRLVVSVITTTKVMSMLGVRNHNLLVEMGIVIGNDFTGYYMESLKPQLDIRGRKGVENVAGWIRHYKNIQNHPVLAEAMASDPGFRAAVFHSQGFYKLEAGPDQPPKKGYFSQLIQERIMKGTLPSTIISMHNNFYWHRLLLEDTAFGQPSVECALAELRSYIYRIVLPRHENLVNEYGRSPYETLRKAGVLAAEDDKIPPINRINEQKIFQNLRHFHNIMSHLEIGPTSNAGINPPGPGCNWFERYGRKNGFIVYILRYFLLLTWHRNLHVTENEFMALAALALGRPDPNIYHGLCLRPTPRCVTIGNWFQDIYRHAYSFLGSILYIRHEFPLPKEIFSGSAWTAFYMSCKDDTFHMGASQVPVELLIRTQQDMNRIIKEKRHMIKYIVEGCFLFDDRF
ncbi:hypothetical protein CHS0354_035953 [Potamilus streckersoni]|uniref:Asteroid domain-containing protein n=1 Tax=Potamilus streckersoni TaxID=2493646 RepID=A0AAE0TFW6_9BIVA|nr:hypothetical protein CHS0354_035953 [Potamilus streckersoni]